MLPNDGDVLSTNLCHVESRVELGALTNIPNLRESRAKPNMFLTRAEVEIGMQVLQNVAENDTNPYARNYRTNATHRASRNVSK